MKLSVDELFECEGYHGCASLFRVRIYAPEDDADGGKRSPATLVILSEIPQNMGTSVTNICEQLAGRVVRCYNLQPVRCMWVEHYEREDVCHDDFCRITFAPGEGRELFASPAWSPLSRAAVEDAIGGELIERLNLPRARYSLGLR